MSANSICSPIGQNTVVKYPTPTTADSQSERLKYLRNHLGDDEIICVIAGVNRATIASWASNQVKITDPDLLKRLLVTHEIIAKARANLVDDVDIQCWFYEASFDVDDPSLTPAEALNRGQLNATQHFAAHTLHAYY